MVLGRLDTLNTFLIYNDFIRMQHHPKLKEHWQIQDINLETQCNPNQNPNSFFQIFHGYQQTDSKLYMKTQMIQNSQYKVTGKEQVNGLTLYNKIYYKVYSNYKCSISERTHKSPQQNRKH